MSANYIGQVPVFFVATSGTPAAVERREHCKITADVARKLGIPQPLTEPCQVRIGVTREDVAASTHGSYASRLGSSANFTVDEVIAGGNRVEIHPNSAAGRNDGGVARLFGGGLLPVDARVTLWSTAPSSTTIDGSVRQSFVEPSDEWRYEELVETGSDDLCVFAPHGGDSEAGTSAQVARLKAELAGLGWVPTVWECRGLGGGETFRRWHIVSSEIHRASFPGFEHLLTVYPPFRSAVALHGFRWGPRLGHPDEYKRGVILGGRASKDDKLALRAAIEEEVGIRGLIAFHVADEREGDASFRGLDGDLGAFDQTRYLRGTNARNVVNRLSPAGIQIEQSRGIRHHPILAEKVAVGIARGLDAIVRQPNGWPVAVPA
jgi:hypothetical protein